MSTNSIPTASHPIAGGQRVDATWYRWLRELERLADKAGIDFSAEIEALCRKLGSPDGTIDGIPAPEPPALVGESPVSVNGPVIGLETVPDAAGGTPQAITVDAYGRVAQRRPIEPDEIPEDFRVWLTDETGAYLTDDLGNYLCAAGIELPSPILNPATWNATQTFLAPPVIDGPSGTGRLLESRTNGLTRWGFGAGGGAESGGNAGTPFVINRFDDAGSFIGQALNINRATGLSTFSSLAIGVNATAAIQAGAIEGQLARWNNTAGRYEPVTAAGLVNAANDAAAAGAGVPVSGIYRNGSVLQIRVV